MGAIVCKGSWESSNNCTVCSRCRETEAAWLQSKCLRLLAENERLRAELDALRADGDVPPHSQAAQGRAGA